MNVGIKTKLSIRLERSYDFVVEVERLSAMLTTTQDRFELSAENRFNFVEKGIEFQIDEYEGMQKKNQNQKTIERRLSIEYDNAEIRGEDIIALVSLLFKLDIIYKIQ